MVNAIGVLSLQQSDGCSRQLFKLVSGLEYRFQGGGGVGPRQARATSIDLMFTVPTGQVACSLELAHASHIFHMLAYHCFFERPCEAAMAGACLILDIIAVTCIRFVSFYLTTPIDYLLLVGFLVCFAPYLDSRLFLWWRIPLFDYDKKPGCQLLRSNATIVLRVAVSRRRDMALTSSAFII